MSDKEFGTVPSSITFSSQVLRIPTLAELGIPMGGYTLCQLAGGLRDYGSWDRIWIERGDVLLKYSVRFFQREARPRFPFISDPISCSEYAILSPISGLLLDMRPEHTVAFWSSVQYQCGNEIRLPVILIPNDEPPPDSANFYTYDSIAESIRHHIYQIPIRHHSSRSVERLQGFIAREGNDTAQLYRKYYEELKARNRDSYRKYDIRAITAGDNSLVYNVQYLRSKNVQLRDKLVHIARKVGDAAAETASEESQSGHHVTHYNFINSQVGAVGQNSSADHLTLSQNITQAASPFDPVTLVRELLLLQAELAKHTTDREHHVTLALIADAASDARAGKSTAALSKLAGAGKWALDFASKIGATLVAEAIKQGTGLVK